MKEDVRELAAVLVGCDVSDILAVRLRETGLGCGLGLRAEAYFSVGCLARGSSGSAARPDD